MVMMQLLLGQNVVGGRFEAHLKMAVTLLALTWEEKATMAECTAGIHGSAQHGYCKPESGGCLTPFPSMKITTLAALFAQWILTHCLHSTRVCFADSQSPPPEKWDDQIITAQHKHMAKRTAR
mmetsp:Transcript_72016/g.120765  ORF Transcript_72016/g.120765 Transcript_72016/m.120765 type:complete len:123 (-) Transcript_72016:721-1089(-)